MEKQEFTTKEDFVKFGFLGIKKFTNSLSKEVALFIACQFALESNFGTSNLAVNHNNLIGMKKPLVRPTTCIAEKNSNGFACYRSKYDCLIDYFLCIAYHRPLSLELEDVKKYGYFIKKFYCPEKDYIEKIMSIYNKFTYLLTQN